MEIKTTKKPWGREELLFLEGGVGIKKLVILPGKMTSYQFHKKKKEVFFVSRGRLELRLENEKKSLKKGEYFYLPAEAKHQAICSGKEDLEIIEYSHPCDDSDIVRLEDPWGANR